MLKYPLKGDIALILAKKVDRLGNILYDKSARNFSPVMAMAATTTIVQVQKLFGVSELDPELIITPCIFIHHIFVHNK